MVAKTDRRDAIRELRRQGHSVGDICERVGVSRQTVWRHCRDSSVPSSLPPTPSMPTNGNGHVDLQTARGVGLDVLVQRAQAGSVSAAAHVFKAASAEIRAEKCVDHIPAQDAVTSLKIQYHLWVLALKGSFQRRLLMEYEDLDPGRLGGLIDDAIDAITRELNSRFEPAEENGHA